MTKYVETQVDDSDQDSALLEDLAEGKPFLFLVAHHEGDGLGIQATAGGGVNDAAMMRKMLELTLKALPGGEPSGPCGSEYPHWWHQPADDSPCNRPAGHPGTDHSNGTTSWREA